MKLLLIEDETELLRTLAKGLEIDGYYVDCAETGKRAMELLNTESYDLVILDLNLPDIHGFDILKNLQSSKSENINSNTKILILTANDDIDSKITGFNLGTSDYLTKPFDFKELELRIGALLRRRYILEDQVIKFGDLEFDTGKRGLSAKGQIINLTKKETAIIEFFLLNPDKIISAEDLLAHVWDSDVDYFSNSIRVHLTYLRKKLKAALGYNPIKNKVGEGYFLER